MPPSAAVCLGAALALAGAAAAAPSAHAVTSTSCSACAAVARTLATRLAGETKRNDLDWRGRVGPEGTRSGVYLAYAESEQRVTDLLDDLCDKGGLMKLSAWWNGPGGAGRWAPKGATPPDGWAVPSSPAEKEAKAKELENFCGRLVEEVEDELGGALLRRKSDGSGGGGGGDAAAPDAAAVRAVLCERLTAHCPPGGSSVSGRGGEL